MLGLGTLSRVLGEIRSDVAAARDRDPAARGASSVEILASWAGVQAILAHRVAHVLHDANVPLAPTAIAYRQPLGHRGRDPPGGADRRRLLHRSRLRRGDRRDGRGRRAGHPLPGRHARRHRISARQAPPDPRRQRHDRIGSEAAGPDHGRRRGQGRREHGRRRGRPARPRRWSATRATRSASRASRSRARTPTGSTSQTPSRRRSRRSPSESPRSSGASPSSRAASSRTRRSASCARSGALLRRRLSPPGPRISWAG